MSEKAMITVVMIARNEERHMASAIESLINQTCTNFVLMIVNNGSVDSTGKIADDFAEQDTRIRVLHMEQNDPVVQYSLYDQIQTPYYMIAAGHDFYAPTFMEKCLALLEADPRVVLAYPRAAWFRDDKVISEIPGIFDTRGMNPVARAMVVSYGLVEAYQFHGIFRSKAGKALGRYHVVGPDHVLLTELATIGSFALVDECLFYLRRADDWGDPDGYRKKHMPNETDGIAPFLRQIDAYMSISEHLPGTLEKIFFKVSLFAMCFQRYGSTLQLFNESMASVFARPEFRILAVTMNKMVRFIEQILKTKGREDSPLPSQSDIMPAQSPSNKGKVKTAGEAAERRSLTQARQGLELKTLIGKDEGKYSYLREDFWPERIGPDEIIRINHALTSFPPSYIHFGGSGDALLLLSTFYDKDPEQTIVSICNSADMMKSFFEAFPRLKKVYFVPFPKNYQWHLLARRFFKSSDICLGLGTTPTTDKDYREWSADLNIFKDYHIQKRPSWAVDFKGNRLFSNQITIQPRGSIKGWMGTKRNVINPEVWGDLLSYLEKKGIKPIIIGTPDEAAEYPCVCNAVDMRSYSFVEQMGLIAASDFFIGADSWGKTFSALAGIPTFVFHAMRGEDLKNIKDVSDYVFLDPWEDITVVKDLDAFKDEFENAWRQKSTAIADPKIRWEGSQFVCHSLALVNRELCLSLIQSGYEVSVLPYEKDQFTAKDEPRFEPIAERTNAPLSGPADIHVRHQWPPNFNPPAEGHWVMIQPWEFGSLPKEWVNHMSSRVDEVWVPSNYVRDCYIQSGIPAERVFVVPNGVNTEVFNPENAPYPLNTKKKFKFLFVGGTVPRKGVDLLLDVYTKTFSSDDDVCLVIKDMGGESFYEGQTAKELLVESRLKPGAPEIEYIDATLDTKEIAGLYRACDCLVHPYRGEGFGLPIAEAMASGRTVIVTGYGAALDFCNDRIAYLIPAKVVKFDEKRVDNNNTVDFPWLAEPDREELARLMRHAAIHREEVYEKGTQASAFIQENFTWEKASQVVVNRVFKLKRKPVIRHSLVGELEDGVERPANPFSMVIFLCNGLNHTKKCVKSIQKHIKSSFEIVFVDNGNNDGTIKWLRQLAGRNEAFKIIENKKKVSLSKAFNQGMKAASGENILLVNNNAAFTDKWLERMLERLEQSGDIGMVASMRDRPDGPDADNRKEKEESAMGLTEINPGRAIGIAMYAGGCLLIRRDVIDMVGVLDENPISEGLEFDDLCLRSSLADFKNIIAHDLFIHHSSSRAYDHEIPVDFNNMVQDSRKYFIEKWKDIVEINGDGYEIHLTREKQRNKLLEWGEERIARGDIKGAVRIFKRVHRFVSDDYKALNNLGVIQWQLGEAETAIKTFQASLAINPKYPDALSNIMKAAKEAGRVEMIKPTLQGILEQVQSGN